MLLTKEQILGANDLPVDRVKVPEWGGEVCVRSLMGWERDRIDIRMNGADKTHYRAATVAMAICDESGNAMGFTEDEVIALSNKSAAPLDRVFEAVCKLSGIGPKDIQAAEDAEKNSHGQNGSSGTA